MGTAILSIVIGTSLWMAFDAHQIGYDKKDVKGMAGMGPLGWLFGGLLLWIVAFPLYLASRSKLKEVAAQQNGHGAPIGESPVGVAARQESEKKSLPSRMGRAFANAVYVLGALFVAIPLLVWISSDRDDKTVSGQPAAGSATIAEAAAAPERPAQQLLQQDGSLVAKKSRDGTRLEFTGPNGQVLAIEGSMMEGGETIPFRSLDAKVFPVPSGGLEVRWVQLDWDGDGPGKIVHTRVRAQCGVDDCIDFLENIAVKGELRQARGVRIEINETIPGHIGEVWFTGDRESMPEMCESAKKIMRGSYAEILPGLEHYPQEQARLRREMAAELDRIERDCRKEIAKAGTASVRWSAL
jgi:hypothetical protein